MRNRHNAIASNVSDLCIQLVGRQQQRASQEGWLSHADPASGASRPS
jgi:hypothetical protein